LIDKLSFLKVGQDAGSASAEEERLMQLFQNRAGLKKAYADLKDEFHLLRDRLKQQEGATIRVQEQLDALGELLADPATGFGALVFYQLRALWKTCHQQIAGFASELTKQQEARELARHQEEVEAERSARRAAADARLQAAAAEADLKREAITAIEAEISSGARCRDRSRPRATSCRPQRPWSATCMPSAARSTRKRRRRFRASPWAPGATSIWRSSVTRRSSVRRSMRSN
jgi:chromosome segregation ATPase